VAFESIYFNIFLLNLILSRLFCYQEFKTGISLSKCWNMGTNFGISCGACNNEIRKYFVTWHRGWNRCI